MPNDITHMQVHEPGGEVNFDNVRLDRGAKVIESSVEPPCKLARGAAIIQSEVGRYFNAGVDSVILRSSVGAFCAFGARTMVNPYSHPKGWLSTHEFCYHPDTFGWVSEYRAVVRRQRPEPKRLTIGADVWTGHGAIIMADIGTGAIIAAGAVVTHEVQPYSIFAGVPARWIGRRFPLPIIERLLRSEWWLRPMSELATLPFDNIEQCLEALESPRHGPTAHS